MRIVSFALAVALAGGCNKGPDVRIVEEALGTAVPIAYVATLASAASDGKTGSCVSLSGGGSAAIEVSDACPLPLAPGARGTIAVTGISNAAGAVYGAAFVDVSVGQQKLIVKDVASFTVAKTTGDLTVAYLRQDVQLNSKTSVTVAQNQWVVRVDTNSTPEVPSDDTTTVNGIYQFVNGGQTLQASFGSVKVSSECLRNPTSGTATIQRVAGGSADIINVRFHSACDGKADSLSVGTSSLLGGSSSSVSLDFLD